MRSPEDRLADILAISKQLDEVVSDGREAFDASWRQQRLVEHLIELIGEAAASLPAEYRSRHDAIPWAAAVATRNRLIHGYFNLNPTRIWATATRDVPEFVELVQELHDRESGSERAEEERAPWTGTPASAAEDLLAPKHVAQLLAVSPRTVYQWIEEGRLPAVKLSERVTRVPAEAVDALVEASTLPAVMAPDSWGDFSCAAESPAIYAPTALKPATVGRARGHSERLWELLQTHRDEILRIVESYNAQNVRVFGSVIHGDATQGSDIDLIVDARPGMSLFDLGAINHELSELLGVSVDVGTAHSLRVRIRDRVLGEAVPL